MVFEKTDANDISELAALRIEFLRADRGEIPASELSLIFDRLPAYFRQHLNRDLLAFVCRDADAIAGCCFLYISEKPPNPTYPTGRVGTALNVYTRPKYRRKGIAGRLLKMLLSEAANLRLDFVELKATDAGYPLYKSLGFQDEQSKYHAMKYDVGTGR